MKISNFELLIYVINNVERFYISEGYVIDRISYNIIRNTLCITVRYLIKVDSELCTSITVNVNIRDYIRETRRIKFKKMKIDENNKKGYDDLYIES